MKISHPNVRRRRARSAALVLAGLMAILGVAFFWAQVIRGPSWSLQSDSNRLRVLPTPAPRGTIFDRYGEIVADNVPSYSVSLFPAPIDSIAVGLERLKPILKLEEERVAELLDEARADPRQPLLVESDAAYAAVAVLEELRADFPGVFLEMRPKRRYMAGESMGHVLGYVGEISGEELELPEFADYEQRMVIGKDGLERQYESILQGTQGVRYIEVDAVGRVVGSFTGQENAPALPGEDLELNLDLGLMQYIHEIFPDSLQGAVVALNVEDGGVLALYSAPSFDPNEFVGGIDRNLWASLNQDPTRPLLNRAVSGRYPPASTWKVATAAIALEMGELSPGDVMPIACNGRFAHQGDVRLCWDLDGHGHLDLAGALANSCNVYFYQVGLRVGLENLVREGSRFGFGELCGVDLPSEARGTFPASLQFWEERFGNLPTENEVLSLSIGQGPNAQTPLKMAQFYLALARGGAAPAPRIANLPDADLNEPGWSFDVSEENLEAIREGLREVTSPGGTAYLSTLEHWDLIGKTGTAEQPNGPSHAWFLGIAGPWALPPEVVVAVIVEEGVSGSSAAAPIAAKAADFHLRRRHGVPTDSLVTLRDHIMVGPYPPWAGQGSARREAPEE